MCVQETTVVFPNPLVVAEIKFTTPRVVFSRSGSYGLQLFGAGQLLREYRLEVALGSSAPHEQPSS